MSTTVLASYDPDDIILTLGAGFIVDQLGEGGVTISRAESVSSVQNGITGDPVVNVSRMKHGTATVSLRAQSDADKILREIVATSLVPVFLFTLEEKGTGALITTQAWVETQPDLTFTDSVADREWVFGLANAEIGIVSAISGAADFVSSLT